MRGVRPRRRPSTRRSPLVGAEKVGTIAGGEARVKLLEAQVEQEYDADEQIERANTADRQGIGSA
jgi:hypothetical protein